MKRPYTAPRIVTQEVHLGVYGDYGGDEVFNAGPATPLHRIGGGQDTES
jgi:hypothetical protein